MKSIKDCCKKSNVRGDLKMKDEKTHNIAKKISLYLFGIMIVLFCLWGLYGAIFYKETIIFDGPNFYHVGYYTNKSESKTEFVDDGDWIELDNNDGNLLYVSIKWECLFKYYSKEDDFPTVKYLDGQGIVYEVYLDDELILTNYQPQTTEYKIASIGNNNTFFRWESKTSYSTSLQIDVSISGHYKIITKATLQIDDEEKFLYNEFSFNVVDR